MFILWNPANRASFGRLPRWVRTPKSNIRLQGNPTTIKCILKQLYVEGMTDLLSPPDVLLTTWCSNVCSFRNLNELSFLNLYCLSKHCGDLLSSLWEAEFYWSNKIIKSNADAWPKILPAGSDLGVARLSSETCQVLVLKKRKGVCIRKEFNSPRTALGHQHGRRFIASGHQYGRRDVMWKRSILSYLIKNWIIG